MTGSNHAFSRWKELIIKNRIKKLKHLYNNSQLVNTQQNSKRNNAGKKWSLLERYYLQ